VIAAAGDTPTTVDEVHTMYRLFTRSRLLYTSARMALSVTLAVVAALPVAAPPTVAAAAPGPVAAWGDNYYGQLGDDSGEAYQDAPVQVVDLTDAVAVAGGMGHSLALLPDGTVWGWGYNSYGQLGDDSTTERHTPVQVSGLTDVVAIACGEEHSLALKSDGTVWAWGWNAYGQLGDGSNDSSDTPVQVSGLSNIVAVAAGFYHSLALRADGTVWSWGGNGYGQLGNNSTSPSNVPVQVSGLTNVVAIACGGEHSLALLADGTMMAWGANYEDQLGDCIYPSQDRSAPVAVAGGVSDVVAIAGGAYHSLAVKADGTVWGWGWNLYYQLGSSDSNAGWEPIRVSDLTNAVSVAAGFFHSAALLADGTVRAWGGNTEGQLGNGTITTTNVPVQVSGLEGASALACGWTHTLAVVAQSTGLAWGSNGNGKLGNNGEGGTYEWNIHSTPVKVNSLSGLADVAAGEHYSLGLLADGTVWAWGYNEWGQLGDGTTTERHTPVQVMLDPGLGTPLTDVTAISAGYAHSMALRSDGTVWMWGWNGVGQLGDGTEEWVRHSPVQVMLDPGSGTPLTDVTAIAAGMSHSMARGADGTVWAWGANYHGRLGDGTTTQRNTPVQVKQGSEPLSGVTSIAAGGAHSMALAADGSVWVWGSNSDGQLGDGTTTQRTTAVKTMHDAEPLSGVSAIAAGLSHSMALSADGTVWAWGSNGNGQLGDGTTTQSSMPVQVMRDSSDPFDSVTSIAAGEYYCLGLRADGGAWSWGKNNRGQLGDGSTTQRLLPVKVAGLADTFVTAVSAYFTGQYEVAHSLAVGIVGAGPSMVDLTLTLEPGWNMVSVPLELEDGDDTVAAIFDDDIVAIYTWNPEQKSYTVPTTIDPNLGYWVAVVEQTQLTVTGIAATTWTGDLLTGWNMIGSVYGGAVAVADIVDEPDGVVLDSAIYWWNPGSKSYDTASTLTQGKGYWAATTEGCKLTMTAPSAA
jgi:alpha-tubulin suppressor-like RCC1 family protein